MIDFFESLIIIKSIDLSHTSNNIEYFVFEIAQF